MKQLLKQIEKQLNKLSDKELGQALTLWWDRNENIGRILDSINGGFVNKKTIEKFLTNIKTIKSCK